MKSLQDIVSLFPIYLLMVVLLTSCGKPEAAPLSLEADAGSPKLYEVTVAMQHIQNPSQVDRLESALYRLHEMVLEVERFDVGTHKGTLRVRSRQDGLALAAALEAQYDAGWMGIVKKTPQVLVVLPIDAYRKYRQ